MTPEQKEKIREEFLQRFFEPTFIDSRPYDVSNKDEEKIDWWLSILDKELEEDKRNCIETLEELSEAIIGFDEADDVYSVKGGVLIELKREEEENESILKGERNRIIAQIREEERSKILTKVMEHAQQNTYEGEEARVYKTTMNEVIDLIHNK